MEFSYCGAGPRGGFSFTKAGVSVRLTLVAKTQGMTAIEYQLLAKRILKLQTSLGIIADADTDQPESESQEVDGFEVTDHPLDLAKPYPDQFVKYTNKQTFENYIARGSFRMGSILEYRNTHIVSALDPQEGFCNIVFRNRNENCFATVISGENLRLFCGSMTVNSNYLKNKFGSVQMVLRDIKGFGETVARHLNARSWEFGRVTYSTQKVFRLVGDFDFSLLPEDLSTNPDVMDVFHTFVVNQCAPGTVFLKPLRCAPEEECRFVFNMSEDLTETFVPVNDPSLLDFFKIYED